MNTEQMELKLARSAKPRALNRRRNLSRASWWFTQMRNAVNEAREWPETAHETEHRYAPGISIKH